MEARLLRIFVCVAALSSLGASYRTQNFIVQAATPQLAQEIGDAAEAFRRDLATEWLGKPLPDWQQPCPIRAEVAEKLGAGGATSFMFERGRPFGWTMTIQGSRERVLDSVLPHEVTHTIFATHFGRPLPRWADEGACTTVEHSSEKKKQEDNLVVFLTTNRGIAFNKMFAMTEYPSDVLPLYSQGYSLARFLIAQGGKPKYVEYVGEGMKTRNWPAATKKYYGFEDLSELQLTWVDWVRSGSREDQADGFLLARREGNGKSVPKTQFASDRGNTNVMAKGNEEPRQRGEITKLAAVATTDNRANDSRPQGGWYARQRDEARTAIVARANGNEAAKPLGHAPLDTTNHTMTAVQTARPQPLERPKQMIIEQSRPPETTRGTVWR